VTLS